jgi:hypothetical protein
MNDISNTSLQNKFLRIIGNFPRHKPVCELHKAFHIPYIYMYAYYIYLYICRKEAKIMIMLMSAI